ncbi:lantibiotic dehydratase [Frankia sp. Cas3]|uniref:lantibiotic dehydratase n=1 Tax=Frankia sp. Cas3 TaxID=3073926 RepID=UPI002AD44CE5|nr:lantibiotic dehydratase [Frankia sp. Cas3]
MTMRSPAVYRWVGAALLRASTDPGELDLPEDLDLFGADAAQEGLAWLSATWQREEIRAAIGQASPALSQQIDDVLTFSGGDARTVRRAVISVASYLLRWQRRPTPFGLFAGVGLARIGAGAKVRWGRDHRVAVRADASWLGDVLARLHRCPMLRERLSVVVNGAGMVRGDRFVAPAPTPDGVTHELAPIEVSVRHSRAVRAALDAAREPVTFGDLRTLLMDRFQGAIAPRIDEMLTGLLDQGILLSNLSAPMTSLDALGHACAQLEAVDAHTIPEIRDLVHAIFEIHQGVSVAGRVLASRSVVTERMHPLSEATDVPLIVDTILKCDVHIPDQVAREARDAVHVLYRLSPYPLGYPAWRDYHSRFRARYGTGACVLVTDLISDSGLGVPADYLGSAHGRTARQVSERDEKLLALIQRATLAGSGEIVLTDQVIDDLAASDPADVHMPARVEVAVEIRSTSVEALARGRFTVAVTGTPRPGSSMAGRHVHLLPPDGRDLIAATFAATGTDAITAQLSFAPRKRRNENVARTEQLLTHVISVAEHREPDVHLIPLTDLAVTVDDRRFYLVQMSTGRYIEPRVTHALEAGVHTPPLARFLAEITTARSAVYKGFHFGAAAQLPHLPRVRYRRTVLSPARWLLAAGELPGRGASMAEWDAALDAWRAGWRIPEHVAMVEHDRRQPVDLGHPLHRLLLRTRLERAGRLELRETSTLPDVAWLGRAHEVLIPLVLDAQATTAHGSIIGSPRAVATDAGHLPGGSTIVYAQLYGHPERFDELLTQHIPRLIDAFGVHRPRWWFRRHREMRSPEIDQYLAVYLWLPEPSAYGSAAERLAGWADGLRREHLLSHVSLTTYEPQSGRYGHGPVLDYVQDVFAADSASAVAQISAAIRAGVHPQALAAASLVDLSVSYTRSAHTGLGWLIRELRQEHGRLDPALREQALELADPHGTWTRLRSLPGGCDVLAAWRTRAVALAVYRDALADQRDPMTVLRSLLHLHHIRAVGVDPVVERVTGRLARTCALRHTAHRTES